MLPSLVEVVDPYGPVGVTRSTYSAAGEEAPYVPRNVDSDLKQSLVRDRFVVVVGPSKSGKTRTAFEALRKTHPEATLIVPRGNAAALSELMLDLDPPLAGEYESAVLWLDDLQRFLSPAGGLDVTLLQSLDRVVVVGTLSSGVRDRLVRASDELSREARVVLDEAVSHFLTPVLIGTERELARQSYPDVDATKGFGEQLVAGPILRQRYLDSDETNPAGRTLLDSAIAWRKTGMTRPMTRSELRDLWSLLQKDRGQPAHSSLFDEAVSWAREPLARDVAPLVTSAFGPEELLEVHPYLLGLSTEDRALDDAPLPDEVWRYTLGAATREDFGNVAFAASNRGQSAVALEALDRLDPGGDPEKEAMLMFVRGIQFWQLNRLPEARKDFEAAMRSPNKRLATRARLNLGILVARQSEYDLAKVLFNEVAEADDPELAAGGAINLGQVLKELRDAAGAEAALLRAVGIGGRRAQVAWINLADLRAGRMDLPGAIAAFRNALSGPEPFLSGSARSGLAWALRESGDEAAARQALEAGRDSGSREIEAWSYLGLGELFEAEGATAGAKDAYAAAIARGLPEVTERAGIQLGMLLVAQGDNADALKAFEQADEAASSAGFRPLGSQGAVLAGAPMREVGLLALARLLEQSGKHEAADAVWHRVSEAKDPQVAGHGLVHLGEKALRDGRPIAAQMILEKAVEQTVGVETDIARAHLGRASSLLALIHQANNDDRAAREALERAVSSGHPEHAPRAASNLGALLLGLGDVEGAERAWQTAVASGHPAVVAAANVGLAAAQEHRGNVPEARAVYEAALEGDDTLALAMAAQHLGELFLKEGDLRGAMAAFTRGVERGHGPRRAGCAYGLGMVRQAQGDRKGAAQAYTLALQDSEAPQVQMFAAARLRELAGIEIATVVPPSQT